MTRVCSPGTVLKSPSQAIIFLITILLFISATCTYKAPNTMEAKTTEQRDHQCAAKRVKSITPEPPKKDGHTWSELREQPCPSGDKAYTGKYFMCDGKRIAMNKRDPDGRRIRPKYSNEYTIDRELWKDIKRPKCISKDAKWPPQSPDDVLMLMEDKPRGKLTIGNCAGKYCWGLKSQNARFPYCNSTLQEPCRHTLKEWSTGCADWESRFEIRHAGDDFGYGIYARQDIEEDTIIGPYVGEILPEKKSGDRSRAYFMGFNTGVCHGKTELFQGLIDAEKTGNWTRFINHSCNPNTYFTVSRVGKSRTCVVATLRDIKAGEEVTADYGDAYFLYMKNLACRCGAEKCRFPTRKHAQQLRKQRQQSVGKPPGPAVRKQPGQSVRKQPVNVVQEEPEEFVEEMSGDIFMSESEGQSEGTPRAPSPHHSPQDTDISVKKFMDGLGDRLNRAYMYSRPLEGRSTKELYGVRLLAEAHIQEYNRDPRSYDSSKLQMFQAQLEQIDRAHGTKSWCNLHPARQEMFRFFLQDIQYTAQGPTFTVAATEAKIRRRVKLFLQENWPDQGASAVYAKFLKTECKYFIVMMDKLASLLEEQGQVASGQIDFWAEFVKDVQMLAGVTDLGDEQLQEPWNLADSELLVEEDAARRMARLSQQQQQPKQQPELLSRAAPDLSPVPTRQHYPPTGKKTMGAPRPANSKRKRDNADEGGGESKKRKREDGAGRPIKKMKRRTNP